VLFMLSGSVHASNISFSGRPLPFNIEVVGRPGQSQGRVTFHGRRMNNLDLLARADALVINGGYSAVSEAFALRKLCFVVPVPGHAEQFVNASLVQDLGLGFSTTEELVLDQLLAMHQRNQWDALKPMPADIDIDGARQAAKIILATASRTATSPRRKSGQDDIPRLEEAKKAEAVSGVVSRGGQSGPHPAATTCP
jgi:hypothetical protein